MAFTSIGYDGTVNERQWAELVPSAGSSTYGIMEADDLKVTAVPGQPLMVAVASGTAWGHGVMDTESANTTITCDAITSGSRWDLIALRRDWQPLAGGPTSAVKVTGTAEKVIPDSRENQPGVIDEQPLALVQWTAGQTQPTAIVDLRCWAGNGGLNAVDELALAYLDKLGAKVRIGAVTWSYGLGANDLAGWTKIADSSIADVPWTNLGMAWGFTPVTTEGWSGIKYAVKNGWVIVNGAVRRPDPWDTGTVCATIPVKFAPAVRVQGTNNAYVNAHNVHLSAGSVATSLSITWPLF